jgi:competence protein ComEA
MMQHITAGAIAASILCSSLVLAQTPPVASSSAQASPAPQSAALNLNTATKADLEKLPGVGPAMAQRILDYRQKNGAFKKAEELMNVQGIGEKSFLKLKPLVTVVPPKTADR